jgi:hypothetical protein
MVSSALRLRGLKLIERGQLGFEEASAAAASVFFDRARAR